MDIQYLNTEQLPQRCHICLTKLLAHPLYDESVALTCTRHGDFFIQRLRNEIPRVIFRPFEDCLLAGKKAGVVGVGPGNPGIKVRCEQTGELYDNIKKAGAAMGISRTRITMHLSGKVKHVNGYTFTKVDANTPADALNFVPKPRVVFGMSPVAIKVRCNETGEEFESVRVAALALMLNRCRVFDHLRDPVKLPNVKGYTFTKVA